MNKSGVLHWSALIGRFLTGQIVVHLVNLVAGLLILRYLSIQEYAIYLLGALLMNATAIGSDMGVSHAVISIGAPLRDDKSMFGELFRSALVLRRRLFALSIPVILVIAYLVFHNIEVQFSTMIAVTLLAMVTAWVQQSVTLSVSVLNAHHDSSSLTRAGLGSALCRLILVTAFCREVPYAVTALGINLVGMLLDAWLLSRFCSRYLHMRGASNQNFSARLLEFAKPLIPSTVYYLLQGQISFFLLAIAGATTAVAQVGALGRLGQILGVLGMVNGFFIQPYFARIQDCRNFATRAIEVIAVLIVAFSAVTASTLIWPDLWLAILGDNYKGLADELVIALVGAQLSLAGGIIYTIVIASRVTRGQWLQIALGLGGQVLFLFALGVNNARDALMLNLIPAATMVISQCWLLAHMLLLWKKYGHPA